MRILYIDIDTLRADHLGCYGYCRDTSPAIDRIAAEGVALEHCYVSDAPCLPSRASLHSGRFGIHNGVVNHGGVAADMRIEGPERGFKSRHSLDMWVPQIKRAGFRTVTISPFADRHSAWWFYAGFDEILNPGSSGHELAPQVAEPALDWLRKNGRDDNWFLHVNMWDPHTPYRTPLDYGDPFDGQPIDDWLTDGKIKEHFNGYGPHSARETAGLRPNDIERYPRLPKNISCKDDYIRWINGYDTGIKYADDHIAMILAALDKQGVLDDTAIIVSSDHGESQGEFNVYGDHHTADNIVSRVPCIIRWPGIKGGRTDHALHYQNDIAATVLELLDQKVPDSWDGVSFAGALKAERDEGREFLVVSQCAWACQRSVRWGDWLYMRTYHDGLKDLAPRMLFNVAEDPHLTRDLASERPDILNEGAEKLERWHSEMMETGNSEVDPLWTVMDEGGPHHTIKDLHKYCEILRNSGRAHHADALMARHGHRTQK